MFSLTAFQTTIVLPNPRWGDSRSILDSINVRRTIDGTRFTYVKRRQARKKLQWQFYISRHKAQELIEFVKSYFASKITIVDYSGEAWIGNFVSNPFEFSTPDVAPQMPGKEMCNIQLEFEGTKVE